jgi:hypothetical protein
LITDGKSQDDIIPPSRNLRESGVELFAIGMYTFVRFICLFTVYCLVFVNGSVCVCLDDNLWGASSLLLPCKS